MYVLTCVCMYIYICLYTSVETHLLSIHTQYYAHTITNSYSLVTGTPCSSTVNSLLATSSTLNAIRLTSSWCTCYLHVISSNRHNQIYHPSSSRYFHHYYSYSICDFFSYQSWNPLRFFLAFSSFLAFQLSFPVSFQLSRLSISFPGFPAFQLSWWLLLSFRRRLVVNS